MIIAGQYESGRTIMEPHLQDMAELDRKLCPGRLTLHTR